MHIGRLYAGIRKYGREKFRWFYHPLLEENEREWFHFFVWVGHYFYVCLERRRKE